MMDEERSSRKTIKTKSQNDDNVDISESFDEIVVHINNLHQDELMEESLFFFEDFLQENFIPVSLFIQFKDSILTCFNTIFSGEYSEVVENTIMIILSDIVEYFEDDFDFSEIFETIWSKIPKDSAFEAVGSILASSVSMLRLFTSDSSYMQTLINYLHDESPEIVESALGSIMKICDEKNNIPFIIDLIPSVLDIAASDNIQLKKPGIITAIAIAKSEAGISYIVEYPYISNIFLGVELNECLPFALKLLLAIGINESKCLQVYENANVLDLLLHMISSEDKNKQIDAAKIFNCIAAQGEDAIQYLFEAEIISKLLKLANGSYLVRTSAVRTLAEVCSKGSAEQISSLIEAGILEIFINTFTSSNDLVLDVLYAFYSILVVTADSPNAEEIISELGDNDQIIDGLQSISDRGAGEEAAIADHILKTLGFE